MVTITKKIINTKEKSFIFKNLKLDYPKIPEPCFHNNAYIVNKTNLIVQNPFVVNQIHQTTLVPHNSIECLLSPECSSICMNMTACKKMCCKLSCIQKNHCYQYLQH